MGRDGDTDPQGGFLRCGHPCKRARRKSRPFSLHRPTRRDLRDRFRKMAFRGRAAPCSAAEIAFRATPPDQVRDRETDSVKWPFEAVRPRAARRSPFGHTARSRDRFRKMAFRGRATPCSAEIAFLARRCPTARASSVRSRKMALRGRATRAARDRLYRQRLDDVAFDGISASRGTWIREPRNPTHVTSEDTDASLINYQNHRVSVSGAHPIPVTRTSFRSPWKCSDHATFLCSG